MKKILSLLMLIMACNLAAQTRDEMIEEFMQERKKMMESIMNLFNEEFEQDFFDTNDPFGNVGAFKGGGNSVSVEEKYEDNGDISIIIKPKGEHVNLDINTTENMITIKSEVKQQTKTDEQGNSFQSSFSSSSSQSIGIPSGYKAKDPVAVDGGIKITLVPSTRMKHTINPNQHKNKPKKKTLLKDQADMI